MTNLASLNLGGNYLANLPTEIGQLTNLNKLDLRSNQLTSLPPQIGQLTNLTSLGLGYNDLMSLPTEIGQLTNLTSLDLNGNELTSLPTEIGQLTNLTNLYLKDNQLASLPLEIGQLTNLTELDLSDNQLTGLPTEIGQLTKLTSLDLSVNPITYLPTDISGQITNPVILNAFAAVLIQNANNKKEYAPRAPIYQNALVFRERELQLAANAYLRSRTANEYNSLAFYQLFQSDGKGAEQSGRRSLELDPKNKYPHTNLPPALLLQGKTKEAKAYYLKWADKPFGEQGLATYRDAFLDDLNAFEKEQVTGIDVDMVRGWLEE